MRHDRKARVEAIEEEFGEPVGDVIRWLRGRLIWADVADVLGYSPAGLFKLRQAYCPETLDEPRKRYSPETTPTDEKAIRLGYDSMADAIRDLQLCEGMTNWQIAKVVGCSLMTVNRHKPDEIKGIYHLSEDGRMKLSEVGKLVGPREKSPCHPWRASLNVGV